MYPMGLSSRINNGSNPRTWTGEKNLNPSCGNGLHSAAPYRF